MPSLLWSCPNLTAGRHLWEQGGRGWHCSAACTLPLRLPSKESKLGLYNSPPQKENNHYNPLNTSWLHAIPCKVQKNKPRKNMFFLISLLLTKKVLNTLNTLLWSECSFPGRPELFLKLVEVFPAHYWTIPESYSGCVSLALCVCHLFCLRHAPRQLTQVAPSPPPISF